MASQEAAVALPWARTDGATLDALGLAIGDRVEVKWELDGDDGTSIIKWWGARVAGVSNDAEHLAYEIRYDPYDDFKEQIARVVFTSSNTLECLDGEAKQETLYWRKEGSQWDVSDEEEDGTDAEEAAAADGEQRYVGLADLTETADDTPEEGGSAVEEFVESLLPVMKDAPEEIRQTVVAGAAEYFSELKRFITAKLEYTNDDKIEASHIREFTAMMQTKRRRFT